MRNLQKYQSDYELILREELLANFYETKGYFSYKHPTVGRISLGSNRLQAMRCAMQLNVGLSPLDKRVQDAFNGDSNFHKVGVTISEYCQYFQNDVLPQRDLTPKTLVGYAQFLKQVQKFFENKDIRQITLSDISQFLRARPAVQSNRYRSMFCVLYKYAMAEGLVKENLPFKTLKRQVKVQRNRLSIETFNAIRICAPDWLKNAMDIALVTGQRVGDIAEMKHSDIKHGFLFIKQNKTSRALQIPVIGQLQEVINRCKSINCDYLITIKDKPITSGYISRCFCRARKESGVCDNIENPPTFHEIRSLSARLQKKSGIDKKVTQNWLGHASEQMTDLYLSRGEEFYETIPPESMLTFSQLITL
jgi:integrase